MQDEAANLKALVKAQGGIDLVLKDDKKMSAVLGALSTGDALQLGAVRQVREMLEAMANEGVHLAIDHPAMRAWWRRHFLNQVDVKWGYFWRQFPKGLAGIVLDKSVKALTRLMASVDAQRAFVARVERDDEAATVSVYEVADAFMPEDASLEAIMASIIGVSAQRFQSSRSLFSKVVNTTAPELRCKLPNVDGTLIGRDADATAIFQALSAGRGAAIIAVSGLGKTQLALEVGWRLARSGGAVAGAFFVDLRGAMDADSVASRFAAALGLDKGGNAEIISRLVALCTEKRSGGGSLLLLVDSVEDALQGEASASGRLRALLAASLAASPRVRLLLTSRVPIVVEGVEEQLLKPLSPAAAARIAAAAAPGLPDADTQAVVSAAGGSPLLLRLLADGIKTGRITTQVRSRTAAGRPRSMRERLRRTPMPQTAESPPASNPFIVTTPQRLDEATAQPSGVLGLALETLAPRNALALARVPERLPLPLRHQGCGRGAGRRRRRRRPIHSSHAEATLPGA